MVWQWLDDSDGLASSRVAELEAQARILGKACREDHENLDGNGSEVWTNRAGGGSERKRMQGVRPVGLGSGCAPAGVQKSRLVAAGMGSGRARKRVVDNLQKGGVHLDWDVSNLCNMYDSLAAVAIASVRQRLRMQWIVTSAMVLYFMAVLSTFRWLICAASGHL
jgi:hypothetical protein